MGWFLTKSKPAKKKPTSKKPATKSWDPSATLRLLKATGWFVFIALLAGAWWMGERHLRTAVAAQKSALPQVELVDVPSHVQQWLVNDIRRSVAAAVDPNPFEQLSLQEVAAELDQHAWIQHVDRVVRKPDGVVSIVADYRKPGALIARPDGYHLIDGAGVSLLDEPYGEFEAIKMNLPILMNVGHAPPDRPGERWRGNDIQAGLLLALLVEQQSWRGQVVAIDVENFDGRINPAEPHLALRTSGGMVRWGRAPGFEGSSEPKTAKKLANLERVRRLPASNGAIDAGGRIVDLAPRDDAFIHDPIQ